MTQTADSGRQKAEGGKQEAVGKVQEFVFFIRYKRTKVRVLKEMSGRTEAEALADLQMIQKAFEGGQAAFEIEGVDYPPPAPPVALQQGERLEGTMNNESSGCAAMVVVLCIVACVAIAVMFRL